MICLRAGLGTARDREMMREVVRIIEKTIARYTPKDRADMIQVGGPEPCGSISRP